MTCGAAGTRQPVAGSTHILASSAKATIPAAASASGTTKTSSTSARTWSSVSCDTCGALSVLAMEDGAMSTGSPAASARAIASAPSVSTPQIRTSGISALSATATPEISAPPPMLTRTSVSGGASSASSRPTVPWPASTVGSSNGCTSVIPSATNSSSSANAPAMSSVSRSSAPAARMRSIDRGGAVFAITTVARTPIPLATSATAMP